MIRSLDFDQRKWIDFSMDLNFVTFLSSITCKYNAKVFPVSAFHHTYVCMYNLIHMTDLSLFESFHHYKRANGIKMTNALGGARTHDNSLKRRMHYHCATGAYVWERIILLWVNVTLGVLYRCQRDEVLHPELLLQKHWNEFLLFIHDVTLFYEFFLLT